MNTLADIREMVKKKGYTCIKLENGLYRFRDKNNSVVLQEGKYDWLGFYEFYNKNLKGVE